MDWLKPDYTPIFVERGQRLIRLRKDPDSLAAIKSYYRTKPADFINDWGCTYDPRAKEGTPATMPFVLMPKQREFVEWLYALWQGGKDGIGEKSRDAGLSWLCVSFGAWMCLHYEGVSIGYGSNLEDNVDKSGDPDSLFWKARMFMSMLPPELANGFNVDTDAPYMRLMFRATGSTMTGSAGDSMGRGGRKTMFFVDESAALPRPMLVDASLSATTNCRVDISTPRGTTNPFAVKRWSGTMPVFTYHWRDDLRKDDAWYAHQVATKDPIVVAQEIDLNYSASVPGVLIPSLWVQAAINAHVKLGFTPSGKRSGALDVADEGRDLNAFGVRYGILLEHLEEWSGKGDDIYGTTQRAFRLCEEHGLREFDYDADGLGAGVRGDARVINELRLEPVRDETIRAERTIVAEPFRGSGEVLSPDAEDEKGRTNKDYFANRKAQAWFALRRRFRLTYRVVQAFDAGEPIEFDPDDLISISRDLPLLSKLTGELSQPTYGESAAGKMLIKKAPDGARSPNLADVVMILYAPPKRVPMVISDEFLEMI